MHISSTDHLRTTDIHHDWMVVRREVGLLLTGDEQAIQLPPDHFLWEQLEPFVWPFFEAGNVCDGSAGLRDAIRRGLVALGFMPNTKKPMPQATPKQANLPKRVLRQIYGTSNPRQWMYAQRVRNVARKADKHIRAEMWQEAREA